MGFQFVRESGVKRKAKLHEKRCGKDFLRVMDEFIHDKVVRACVLHNGSKKTLDATVAQHVLGE